MPLPLNFNFIWENLLAGSAHPGAEGELVCSLAALAERGIGAIVSLSEEPLDPAPLREFEIHSLHLPVIDFTAPTQEQIDKGVRFIADNVERGRPTLVHCRAGIGRTGTLLACFLVSRGQEPAEAIRQLRRHRPGSCEVYAQEFAVHEYARRLRGEEEERKRP